jgi:hypothetical protein
MRFGIARIQSDRPSTALHGFRQVALVLERHPQMLVQDRIPGVDIQCAPDRCFRRGMVSAIELQQAQHVMRVSVSRLVVQQLLVELPRAGHVAGAMQFGGTFQALADGSGGNGGIGGCDSSGFTALSKKQAS